MAILRSIKRKLKASVMPCVFLALAGYFGWSATQGDRGSQAKAARQADFDAATAQLAKARGDLRMWELRVAALNSGRIDPDALDERVRAMLNLSEPTDIVLLYPDGKKLF